MHITIENIDVEKMAKEGGVPLHVIQRIFKTQDHADLQRRLKTVSTRREVWEIYQETKEGSSILPLVIQRLNEIMLAEIENAESCFKLKELYQDVLEGSTAEEKLVRKIAAFFLKRP